VGVAAQSHEFNTLGDFHNIRWVLQMLPAWYLAPFLLGIIGGTAAYVAVKNEDQGTADNLLVFGFLWSLVLGLILWFLTPH
jgi:hypothetical protein